MSGGQIRGLFHEVGPTCGYYVKETCCARNLGKYDGGEQWSRTGNAPRYLAAAPS